MPGRPIQQARGELAEGVSVFALSEAFPYLP